MYVSWDINATTGVEFSSLKLYETKLGESKEATLYTRLVYCKNTSNVSFLQAAVLRKFRSISFSKLLRLTLISDNWYLIYLYVRLDWGSTYIRTFVSPSIYLGISNTWRTILFSWTIDRSREGKGSIITHRAATYVHAASGRFHTLKQTNKQNIYVCWPDR